MSVQRASASRRGSLIGPAAPGTFEAAGTRGPAARRGRWSELAESGTGRGQVDLLRTAFDESPDGLALVDRTGCFVLVNARLAAMFGWPTGELEGRPVEVLVPERVTGLHRAHRERYMRAPARRPMGVGLQLVGRRRDGSVFPTEISLAPAGDGVVVASVRDVTERSRMRQELELAHARLAVTEERERISRDLHDTVMQQLYAIGLSLQAVGYQAEPTPVAERLAGVVDAVDASIRQLRSAVFGLHHDEADATATQQVSGVVEEFGTQLALQPSLQLVGPVDELSQTVVAELLPTLREALSNVARHADARHVDVRLVVDRDLLLQVDDDGRGPDAEADAGAGEGYGLANMRSRAAQLGGTLTLQARETGGARLEWRVPRS